MTLSLRFSFAILTVLFSLSIAPAAQEAPSLSGTWRNLSDARPDGFAIALTMRVAANELVMERSGYPSEIYRLDGVETQLPDGRRATASLTGGSLTLTIVRARSNGEGIYRTTAEETYRVSGNSLTLERQMYGQRPDEPRGQGPTQTLTYTRD